MKNCITCGIPMKEKSDFTMGDESKDYCVYCTNEDGTMHTFEQKKVGMTEFIVKTQGLDPVVAEDVALSMMRKLPAWADKFEL
ncbi:MAG: zinc ribbon domain-containing protein [Sphaerochaetaceae bacterium]